MQSPPGSPSCCHSGTSGETASHCDVTVDEHDESVNSGGALQFVQIEDAAKCRGIHQVWSMLSYIMIDLAQEPRTQAEPRLLYCLAIHNDVAISRTFCPDPPIP